MIDICFRFIVYAISIYLILIKNSIIINISGFIILLSHIYKDITCLNKWPYWSEYIGFLLGLLLIYEGIKIKNIFIIFIGFIKIFAHIRQVIYNDDRYYY